MSADVLRRAAALMRERAEAATPGPWSAVAGAWGLPSGGPDHMRVVQSPPQGASDALARLEWDMQGGDDAEHIAAWHPAVALAVADWLDEAADFLAAYRGETHAMDNPLAVAVAYLDGAA